ncbi:MAG: hypothetical protein A3I44_03960 [Candidatus Sungbacteria bacterium RIFCSPLOWO2_02_FULL_51_17]|uniref:DUF4440 domain-containing protein n=1 Tax=Candidatus Sungbacteria bacterium RIFCSPHIGHO2_02_FULL_51_29 TaxID=1802273 RepID=A0A1G2KUD9_9BACT|nr:MAG: hypothetical protein A2676_02480 [Candidatus Sungbacteria bacterium RIFCSPHIGHO2_01_FULL_51_22]OHA02242.1 MAG: hypothetical protein A3C16_04050 [Candidatus Sungbacteria bacterium RIFCSPHIGHO2_02_FULL_51_29]OHA06068.1 MAG: hypothetical protein A3B29_05355 [Candidatus Sungbacteria bacterium RIFCSPLOWO2_01_FULL_51_34]OHA11241.1 MAG: hypothetical protein A3I44_03960 [Candidatus Sungbacteria bacterium RIFCSPLOWO2_02_FULL_51_17]
MKRKPILFFAAILPIFLMFAPFVLAVDAVNQPTTELLEKRVHKLLDHVKAKEFDAVWDMAARNIKNGNENDKHGYVKELSDLFSDSVFEYGPMSVRRINQMLGVSSSLWTLRSEKDMSQMPMSECQGVVWVWENDSWYFARTYVCHFEREVIEDMMRYSDIKNAPK